VKLRIGKRAQQQAGRIDAWWTENRPSAQALFLDELEATFRHICENAQAGIRWPTARRPNLRRILMPRTKNHVYFVIDVPTQTVSVHAIWGAPKQRAPKL
jgi:plasmid stabilization system protein ParE